MPKILRAALYERVSTDEQALKGFSIKAQRENLEEHCQKNKMKIVDHYTDEGISGSKPPLKRPDLQRLLDDVQAGKVDIILFTKLDRWFRSVKEYFKVQEILDDHKVQWRAIHENYDTTTANGQMAITIFLAVAQNERDRTAERIHAVFDSKLKNKEYCFGGKLAPMGYKKVKDKDGVFRLKKDKKMEPIVQEFWNILIETHNLNHAIRYMQTEHGITKDPKTWIRISKNTFYCGMHKGIEDFCEPYVSPEDFLKFQETRPVKNTPTGRIYMFKGLIRCPGCGHKLCGDAKTNHKNGKIYKGYRCRMRGKSCTNPINNMGEIKLEKSMVKNIEQYVRDEIAHVEIEEAKPKPQPSVNKLKKLKEQRRRLEIIYLAGNKSDDEYLKEDAELKISIEKLEKEAPPEPKDLTPLKEFLEMDFQSVYKVMNDEEKQIFWLKLVKEIVVDHDKKIKRVRFF